MRYTTLGAALVAAMLAAAPAWAQCVTDPSGNVFCDPAVLHVSGPNAIGTDPVVIGSNTEFTVLNNSAGQSINSPLTLYFALPVFGTTSLPAPVINHALLNGAGSDLTVSPISELLPQFTSGDFYKDFIGCKNCDGSESFGNFNDGLVAAGLGTATAFDVYTATIDVALAGKDFVDVTGSFSNGTYIVPLAKNIEPTSHNKTKTTYFDAAFTETGLVNVPHDGCTDCGGGGGGNPVPEPMTLSILGLGLLGLGAARKLL